MTACDDSSPNVLQLLALEQHVKIRLNAYAHGSVFDSLRHPGSGSGDQVGANFEHLRFRESDPNAGNRFGAPDPWQGQSCYLTLVRCTKRARKGQRIRRMPHCECGSVLRALKSQHLIDICDSCLCNRPSGLDQVVDRSGEMRAQGRVTTLLGKLRDHN